MPIIEEAIRRIVDGSIINYVYNRRMQMLEMKPQKINQNDDNQCHIQIWYDEAWEFYTSHPQVFFATTSRRKREAGVSLSETNPYEESVYRSGQVNR